LHRLAADAGLFIVFTILAVVVLLLAAVLLSVFKIIPVISLAFLPVLAFFIAVKSLPRSLAVFACILLIPAAFSLYPLPSTHSYYAELLRQPWVPDELITLTSGRTIDGYVLSEDQDWVTVLSDQTRRIYYYPPDQVRGRQVCQRSGALVSAPLISLIPAGEVTRSGLPQC